VLKRIKALAIPPAWTDVWICPFADGHVQATGRDAKRRKQYRYHVRFREVRESTKYEHVVAFADALRGLRGKVQEHMALRGLPREKVLATVVHLLETTLIRVGNGDSAKQNNSYGLTTLKNRHVAIDGNEVRFRFTGKSGKQWSLRVRDRRIAKIIKACQELPGQELLQYIDEAGNCQDVTSTDVNNYLKEITGKDITAKDFRTSCGSQALWSRLRVFSARFLEEIAKHESPMPSHKFHIGETVTLIPSISRNVAGGIYQVVRQLPHNGRDFEYQIKSANEEHQRVADSPRLRRVHWSQEASSCECGFPCWRAVKLICGWSPEEKGATVESIIR
jgi:DNA topoisomerase IB